MNDFSAYDENGYYWPGVYALAEMINNVQSDEDEQEPEDDD